MGSRPSSLRSNEFSEDLVAGRSECPGESFVGHGPQPPQETTKKIQNFNVPCLLPFQERQEGLAAQPCNLSFGQFEGDLVLGQLAAFA